jgi:Flp pilus assembly protein TadB
VDTGLDVVRGEVLGLSTRLEDETRERRVAEEQCAALQSALEDTQTGLTSEVVRNKEMTRRLEDLEQELQVRSGTLHQLRTWHLAVLSGCLLLAAVVSV